MKNTATAEQFAAIMKFENDGHGDALRVLAQDCYRGGLIDGLIIGVGGVIGIVIGHCVTKAVQNRKRSSEKTKGS